jgi:positive regulator of sigma E activity
VVVPDDDIARAAAITYLPLVVGLLAGAALAGSAGNFADGITGFGALLGGAVGWAIGRTLSRHTQPRIRIVRDAGLGTRG